MKNLHALPLLLLFVTGCYTTPAIRQRAQDLAVQMSTYRDDQSARVEKINAEYHQTFAQLIDKLTEIQGAQLDLDREVEAQRIADHIISDVNATLRQTFRDAFGTAVNAQREEIAQADLAIAAARDAYSQAYTDAKLKLDDLDRVIGNLRILAAAEDRQQTALDFIESVASAYDKIREEAQQNKDSQAKKDQKSDAATTPKK